MDSALVSTTPTPAATKRLFKLWVGPFAFTLVVLGGAASTYLLIRHFSIGDDRAELIDLCEVVFQGDCDEAIGSPMGVQLGIPRCGWCCSVTFSAPPASGLPRI